MKTRNSSGKFLAIVRELARFRESYAQERNIPRNRVFKDDALVELASTKPQNEKDLGRSRLLLRDARKGEIAAGILASVKAGACREARGFSTRGDRAGKAASQSGTCGYVTGFGEVEI